VPTRIQCSPHVLSIKHLLCKFRDASTTNSMVLLAATSSQGSETSHEEVQMREGDYHGINILDNNKGNYNIVPMLTTSFHRSELS